MNSINGIVFAVLLLSVSVHSQVYPTAPLALGVGYDGDSPSFHFSQKAGVLIECGLGELGYIQPLAGIHINSRSRSGDVYASAGADLVFEFPGGYGWGGVVKIGAELLDDIYSYREYGFWTSAAFDNAFGVELGYQYFYTHEVQLALTTDMALIAVLAASFY